MKNITIILLMLLLPFLANAQTQSPPPTKQETIEWILKKMMMVVKEKDKSMDLGSASFSYTPEGASGWKYLVYLDRVVKFDISDSYIYLFGKNIGEAKDSETNITFSYDDVAFLPIDVNLDDNLVTRFEKAFDALIDFNKVGKPAEKY